MSKELEILEELRQKYGKDVLKGVWNNNADNYSKTITVNDYLDIIETALKEYEQLKSIENNVLPNDEFIGYLGEHTRDEVAMKLKALEIIKNKRVDIVGVLLYAFKKENGCEFYNSYIPIEYKITQEEYNLLKEVLL